MAKQLIFENVTSNAGVAEFQRAKVVGGWLLLTIIDVLTTNDNIGVMQDGYEWRTGTTFIPDPDHKWLSPEESD